MARLSPQLIVFSYHKSGTSLFLHVMRKVSARLGLTLVNLYGMVTDLDDTPDVVLVPHALLRAPLNWPYRAIRLIRDPRDIWVSGYLYHLRSIEEWCTETRLDPTPPILWPRVDSSFEHWPEDWKRDYLLRLNGKSYQQNLLERPREEGLDFELAGFTGCTLQTMGEWPLNGAEALDIRLEDVMANFDVEMNRIFSHFGLTGERAAAALDVARTEDIRRMDDAAVAERPQITSREISKWREVLTARQIAEFESVYGDLITTLGYERARLAAPLAAPLDTPLDTPLDVPLDVPLGLPKGMDGLADVLPAAVPFAVQLPDLSPPPRRTAGPCIRLIAGGRLIPPAMITQCADGGDRYRFVVPPKVTEVRLRSRSAAHVDVSAPFLGESRPFGVEVQTITIRSRAGNVVIPADDPRLASGWHDVTHVGIVPWRWTDGLAEIPWPEDPGPAVLEVHCRTLASYVTDAPETGEA